MRREGYVKNTLILLAEFLVLYCLTKSVETTSLVTALVAFYGCFGGVISLCKKKAVPLHKVPEEQAIRLNRAKSTLAKEIKEFSNEEIESIRWYLLPSDEIKAFTYGKNIVITSGLLTVCDELTLNAVLAREIYQSMKGAAFVKRVIWANMVLMLLSISICCLGWMAVVVVFAIVLSFLGRFGCIFGMVFCKISNKVLKVTKYMMQHTLLWAYGKIISGLTARIEYRADSYACSLGYGFQLKYYLEKYKNVQTGTRDVVRTSIYDVRLDVDKRIEKLQLILEHS